MFKRALILDGWDTAHDGRLTLTSIVFDPPTVTQVRQSVPGLSGDVDLSEVASGAPTYGTRTLTATLESTFGRRSDRIAVIDDLIARVHGKRVQIGHPDYPDGYYSGRVEIGGVAHHAAYSELALTATCDPFRYTDEPTVLTFAAKAKTLGVADIGIELITASGTGAVHSTAIPSLEVTCEVGSSAVFRFDAYPECEYYVAMQRNSGRGRWRLASENTEDAYSESCYVRADDYGHFYLKIDRFSTEVLRYVQVRAVPTSELIYAQAGVAPVVAEVCAEATVFFSSGGGCFEIGTSPSQVVLGAGSPALLAISAAGGEWVELKYRRKAW